MVYSLGKQTALILIDLARERAYNIAFTRDGMTNSVPAAHENSLNNLFPRLGEVDDTIRIGEKSG